MDSSPQFTDAQAMAVAHPTTFDAPDAVALGAVGPGSIVKLCAAECERFWVIVQARDGEQLSGTVDNDLLWTDTHGLRLGDTVQFAPRHIYQIWEEARDTPRLH